MGKFGIVRYKNKDGLPFFLKNHIDDFYHNKYNKREVIRYINNLEFGLISMNCGLYSRSIKTNYKLINI